MNIKEIFVHCSATKPNMDIGVETIKEWHTRPKDQGGRGWRDIGYHFVIRRDGTVEDGRLVTTQGAHAYGYNKDSIGICLVGGLDMNGKSDANFTFAQYESLVHLIDNLKAKYGLDVKVRGHRDVAAKDCPCFDVHSLIQYI